MTTKKLPDPQQDPPYPLTPEERAQRQQRQHEEEGSFDLKPLEEAMPQSLRVGETKDGEVKRTSSELRRNYEKGDLPEALKAGAGKVSAEMTRPDVAPAPASEIARSDASTPPQFSANLSQNDRLDEFSATYHPPRPAGVLNRHPSVASSGSSAFEPSADLSSVDASYSRAMPGERGAPTVGMDGWQEAVEEEAAAKTWEEDLERRARAGAELERRAQEAQRKEQEERLQREFWDQERKDWDQQAELAGSPRSSTHVPLQTELPASLPSSNPWSEQVGSPTNVRAPVPHAPVQVMAPAEPITAPASHPEPMPQTQDAPTPVRTPRPAVDPATEIYQVKHVNLISPVTHNLHRVPILTQNANGPCPLMALVNAITLSTPPTVKSAIFDALRLREQISLSLLLEVVFEELMARTQGDLPDVSEMFAFLKTLHTGMNVNPRFDSTPGAPGAFEATHELSLYSSFSVPLVHGWLPVPNSPASEALSRSAKTYDEAMTLLFAEEELISSITSRPSHTATDHEQTLLADAQHIREFIDSSSTQLTTHGLDTLRRLRSYTPAILFRNDHFSTIMVHDGHLVALVTDMGFATHEEVIWERIADVNAHENSFLSGDFRPVGGRNESRPPSRPLRSMLDPDSAPPPPPRTSSVNQTTTTAAEDTDYDLALAMQLQEEENERQRRLREREREPQQPPQLPPRQATPPPPYVHAGLSSRPVPPTPQPQPVAHQQGKKDKDCVIM